MRALRSDQGKPAAALAIIASIFAIAFVIKLLPPATRQALLPVVVQQTLPYRALQIWSTIPEGVPSVAAAARPAFALRASARQALPSERQALPVATTPDLQLTFDDDPGDVPLIPSTPLMPVALPMASAPVHAEIDISDSLLALPFTKTGSALRVAFLKTGSAIKAAASGTAGVFVSNP